MAARRGVETELFTFPSFQQADIHLSSHLYSPLDRVIVFSVGPLTVT